MAAGLFHQLQQPFNVSHGDTTVLTSNQIAGFTPYIQFARAAYCDSSKIIGWKCGDACDALPGFVSNLTGGDGDDVQFFFVGFWPTQSAVVVVHQGTNPQEFWAVDTDIHLNLISPDSSLFPNLPDAVEVHSGFADEHKKTANQILAEVQRLMAEHSSTNVILVGHSLGGALAELDSLFMKLNLPEGTSIRGVTFGTPRVGNKDWATFFDSQVSDFTRMNNMLDPVTIIPGRGLGFRHPSGEIHIQSDGRFVVCPGPDSDDPQCSYQMVPTVGRGNRDDHSGPYNGIYIGTQHCTP